ncbi:MAG TPA: hypothetical protein VFV75_12795 [Candidatus Polarisedimenticolaceae bacterium]|nr:hypothetical protein [Candidatus Polarisedimenticolaceae bacterium]
MAERFRGLEASLSLERGGFFLFALFSREGSPDRWDLMVSAPWLPEDRHEAVTYLVDQIKLRLSPQDLVMLSRIIVIDPANAALQDFTRWFDVEHGRMEAHDADFFGLTVRHAVIITSKAPPAPAAA